MEYLGHKTFGEEFCEHFDVPQEYYVWAYAPDWGYYLSHEHNVYLHRFTLHGFNNVQTCINLLKDKVHFPYDDEYLDVINALVVSHTYLDLFNNYIVPSYPRSGTFKGLPEQRGYYLKVLLGYIKGDVPKPSEQEYRNAFKKILNGFSDPWDIEWYMTEEFKGLPQNRTQITEILLDIY